MLQTILVNAEVINATSPNGKIGVKFQLTSDGRPFYKVVYDKGTVIDTSFLGLQFKQVGLQKDLEVVKSNLTHTKVQWQQVWGDTKLVDNNYNQLLVDLKSKSSGITVSVVFRVFDDGIGFRYEMLAAKQYSSLTLVNEGTNFNMTGDPTCWWIPGDWDSDEYLYTKSKMSEIRFPYKQDSKYNYLQDTLSVNTPVTLKTNEGLYVSIHEAALYNYPSMTLHVDQTKTSFISSLVGSSDSSVKAVLTLPFISPWRTIQIADDAKGLLSSHLILNLNEPNKIKNTSWIKPSKYAGVWWEMHIGISNHKLEGNKHGANTENVKRYIDFAAENGIEAVLIEGWNTGWEKWLNGDAEKAFDFVTPYADYNIAEIASYAKIKKVKLIGHHETCSSVLNYEEKIDAAFAFLKNYGIDMLKTGYVGRIIPKGEHHYGQWMVNHYQKVTEKAVKEKVMLDVHESIKPTGISRTYPNLMSFETMRAQEFNAWSNGNMPIHNTILPFTRGLAGPMDFTPGIFDITLSKSNNRYQENGKQVKCRVHNTLSNQLALYIVFYSPLQMVSDLPESYRAHPAFQFIKNVPVDWDDSKILNAEIGEYLTVARKEKGKEKWYVGGITNELGRQIKLPLNFLNSGRKYKVTIYADADDAHFDTNPTAYKIETKLVDNSTVIDVFLAPGGGFAIEIE